jgi:hypothetical protein
MREQVGGSLSTLVMPREHAQVREGERKHSLYIIGSPLRSGRGCAVIYMYVPNFMQALCHSRA